MGRADGHAEEGQDERRTFILAWDSGKTRASLEG